MSGRRRNWLITGVVLAAVGALAALSWTHRDRFTPVDVGSRAPAFEFPDLDGQPVSLADFRGKVVMLNIWATWCPPCVWEMPAMERLYEALAPHGFEVVAVSVDAATGTGWRRGGDVREFVEERDLRFTVLLDPAGEIQRLYSVVGLPTTFLIDRDGRIQRMKLGPAPWDEPPYADWVWQLLEG